MRVFFLALAIIWPLTILIVGLNIPSDPAERHTDVSAHLVFRVFEGVGTDTETDNSQQGDLVLSGKGDLLLNNTDGRLSWYVYGAINEILLLIFLYGLLIMRKLFVALAEGQTFTEENSDRIRKVGFVFIAWHVTAPVLQYIGSRMVLQDIVFNTPGVQLSPGFEINIGGLFAGLAIIVLSGVLLEAAGIHKEQELTI
jgi:hypothetical protein